MNTCIYVMAGVGLSALLSVLTVVFCEVAWRIMERKGAHRG